MTSEEFVNKMLELVAFYSPEFNTAEPLLELMAYHFGKIVNEFNRLEDLEDDTTELKAYIEKLEQDIDKLKKRTEEVRDK